MLVDRTWSQYQVLTRDPRVQIPMQEVIETRWCLW
jgi:hypothetical protein